MKTAWHILLVIALLPAAVSAKSIRASLDPVKDEPPITAQEREHWAFTPLQRPEVPAVRDVAAARNDMDRFVLAKLEAAGLTFAQPADAATLMRRVTFDLTGLPPSPEAVTAFAANPTDAAYAAYVDSLLASPQYGEAQAQPWLDLARFAETDGFEHDIERKHAWKYRDWVIAALNRDLPFDDFVRQQIAGDQLANGEAVATGFLVAGPDMPDINNQDERRHFVLNDITATVGSAFLGLTMGCAQCHDHPYDPVSQADFYRLRAFFDPMSDFKRDRQLDPELRRTNDAKPVSQVFVRGDFRRPGPEVGAGFPRIAHPQAINQASQRADLAQWLTRADNALFVRVAVNRVWQQQFGRGLVVSSGDFGHQGEAPTHPELLDWLATELPRQGWSLKKLHKLIVMSATYRQASFVVRPPGLAALNDGLKTGLQTELYSGFPRHRLTGEALRDAMLFTAGLLNPRAGGPSVRLPLPPEVSSNLLRKQMDVTPDTTEHDRRSIYTFSRRNLRHPLFDLFDRPDALMSCSRRTESTTAPQALLLFNSEFSQRAAGHLAERILEHADTAPEALVAEATRLCFARKPTAKEAALGVVFLQKQAALAPTLRDALTDYCLALMNSNAFVWID